MKTPYFTKVGMSPSLAVVLCLLIGARAMGQGAPAAPNSWQQAAFTVDPLTQSLAGLHLRVDLDAQSQWPRLMGQTSPCTARHADDAIHAPNPARAISPVVFGLVQVPGATQAALKTAGRAWCGGEATIGYRGGTGAAGELKLVTSRLSPGVLLSAPAGVTLFAGAGLSGS